MIPQTSKRLGILGGGQLGRMSALAAANLGIRTHIYTPESNGPAEQVACKTTIGNYENINKIKMFCDEVDVVSYEFENIPVETIRFIQKHKPVYPDDRLIEITQHRVREKSFLNDIGIPTAKWAEIKSADDIIPALNAIGAREAILKTTRFGYDGKGQLKYKLGDDIYETWAKLGATELICEDIVPFSCEISAIIARDRLGQMAFYGPVQNEHRNHILSRTIVPAQIPERTAAHARKLCELLAEAVDLTGVLALEMFLCPDGRLLANEIAPRTHNSGHWTINACACSQFEQHVRTVCGLPIGVPARHSDAVMLNVLGEDLPYVAPFYEAKNACIHFYGKQESRTGRKMGHVTILKERGQNDTDPATDGIIRKFLGHTGNSG